MKGPASTDTKSSSGTLHADLVVVGGGMAGITAAGIAASVGKRVVLLEKTPAVGGSALLSEGYLWTAPSLKVFRAESPQGQIVLQRQLLRRYPDAVAWVRGLDKIVTGPIEVLGIGRGYRIDVNGYLEACLRLIRHAEGLVVTGAETDQMLSHDSNTVVGVRFHTTEGNWECCADWTLLATGGWQGDDEMRRRYLHPTLAGGPLLRANPASTGDGLRLGLSVGASLTGDMSRFYGHLMAAPLISPRPQDLQLYSQQYSQFGVLLNTDGQRFCDESMGDQFSAQAVLGECGGRAALITDEWVRTQHVLQPTVPGMDKRDKFRDAVRGKANFGKANTLEELAQGIGAWGFNQEQSLATITSFNQSAGTGPELLAPAYSRALRPLDRPPFYALEVQSGITFTYGGLAVDPMARVLNEDRAPMIGLLAAGADIGGVYGPGYCGGLALATVFGLLAAETVLSEGGKVPVDAGDSSQYE